MYFDLFSVWLGFQILSISCICNIFLRSDFFFAHYALDASKPGYDCHAPFAKHILPPLLTLPCASQKKQNPHAHHWTVWVFSNVFRDETLSVGHGGHSAQLLWISCSFAIFFGVLNIIIFFASSLPEAWLSVSSKFVQSPNHIFNRSETVPVPSSQPNIRFLVGSQCLSRKPKTYFTVVAPRGFTSRRGAGIGPKADGFRWSSALPSSARAPPLPPSPRNTASPHVLSF